MKSDTPQRFQVGDRILFRGSPDLISECHVSTTTVTSVDRRPTNAPDHVCIRYAVDPPISYKSAKLSWDSFEQTSDVDKHCININDHEAVQELMMKILGD